MKDRKIAGFSILGVLLVAGVVAFPPGGLQAGARNGPSTAAVVTSSGVNATFSEGHGAGVYSSSCIGPLETYGNMTLIVSPCIAYGFPSAFVRNATLDTPQVLPFIKTAYEYHLVYFARSAVNQDVMYAVLNVTGSQVVNGNYTSGYRVSYLGNKILNVTFLQVTFQHFDVMHVSSYLLPDRNESVSYTPQQVRAIHLALADTNVTSLMVDSPYFVKFAGSAGSATTPADYVVQLYQVDGTRIVGAFVNPDLNSVSSYFSQQRGSGECWPGGVVVTDPWGETGFGCTA
ncbi:MAG: hypothetical protein OK442_00655 [Thaumarchaeota archaeon]|nr:hypothetical protein [Nitrososphaerota archaeon]